MDALHHTSLSPAKSSALLVGGSTAPKVYLLVIQWFRAKRLTTLARVLVTFRSQRGGFGCGMLAVCVCRVPRLREAIGFDLDLPLSLLF